MNINSQNIAEQYKFLNISEKATQDEITSAFKKLALKYHPDRNRDKAQWATEAMTRLNIAYNAIITHRFKSGNDLGQPDTTNKKTGSHYHKQRYNRAEEEREILTQKFIRIREIAKDSIYIFFQYNLYNLARRDAPANARKFRDVVLAIRKCFHHIHALLKETDDPELVEHFLVFSDMLFNFYRAAECLNIIDSYSNQMDVDAYRMYKYGDEALHAAQKELFYDRHNRGVLKKDLVYPQIMKAESYFERALAAYPNSTWALETGIKLEYAKSLRKYFLLFFYDK